MEILSSLKKLFEVINIFLHNRSHRLIRLLCNESEKLTLQRKFGDHEYFSFPVLENLNGITFEKMGYLENHVVLIYLSIKKFSLMKKFHSITKNSGFQWIIRKIVYFLCNLLREISILKTKIANMNYTFYVISH